MQEQEVIADGDGGRGGEGADARWVAGWQKGMARSLAESREIRRTRDERRAPVFGEWVREDKRHCLLLGWAVGRE